MVNKIAKFFYTGILFAIWYAASAVGIAVMLWCAVKMLGVVASEVSWLWQQVGL